MLKSGNMFGFFYFELTFMLGRRDDFELLGIFC